MKRSNDHGNQQQFIKNTWYFAAYTEELEPGGLLSRKIAGVNVLIWANTAGEITAMEDSCPHRMVPLSLGKHEGDGVRCAYHGIKYGADGCLDNPYGPATKSLCPNIYTLVSRHGVLWVWLGNSELADPADIPEVAWIGDTPDTAIFRRHLLVEANHQLLVDNILDLSHADHLHPDTLGGGGISSAVNTVTVRDDGLTARWDWGGQPVLPLFRLTMPTPETIADSSIEVIWWPSGVMTLENKGKPVDHPDHPGYRVMSSHVMTPADDEHTHYFYAVNRNFLMDDAEFNKQMEAGFYQAFACEDKPLIEAQQAALGHQNIMDMGPRMFAIDKAPVQARRIFDKQLEAERTSGLQAAE